MVDQGVTVGQSMPTVGTDPSVATAMVVTSAFRLCLRATSGPLVPRRQEEVS